MAGSKRREYLKDVELLEDGTYAYTGAIYRAVRTGKAGDSDTDTGRIKPVALLAIGAVVMMALALVSGCIDADNATKTYSVIVPYIGEMAALFVICLNVGRLVGEGSRIRAFKLDPARDRIPPASKILAAFAAIGMAFSVYHLIKYGPDGSIAKSIAYPAIKLVIAVMAVKYGEFFNSISWVKEQ